MNTSITDGPNKLKVKADFCIQGRCITETSPYLLGNFHKFISNIVFELSSKYLQKHILSIL